MRRGRRNNKIVMEGHLLEDGEKIDISVFIFENNFVQQNNPLSIVRILAIVLLRFRFGVFGPKLC